MHEGVPFQYFEHCASKMTFLPNLVVGRYTVIQISVDLYGNDHFAEMLHHLKWLIGISNALN